MDTRRARRGGNAVEFGLMLPLYVALVFGIIDYGWMMYHYATLHAAAHKGCRAGTLVDPGPDEEDLAAVITRAQEAMAAFQETHGPGCGSGCATSVVALGENPSRSIACSIEVGYEPIVGFGAQPVQLAASAVMRLEYQRAD